MAIFNSYVSLPEGIKIANDFWQESQSHYEIIETGIISISYPHRWSRPFYFKSIVFPIIFWIITIATYITTMEQIYIYVVVHPSHHK